MAGHSQFKNILHRKAAQDKKKAKVATKLIRDIMTAARIGGGDANANPSLRAALDKARKDNLNKDTLDRAIKRGTGEIQGADYLERTYEGYGPGGVAVLVSALTDNPTRTITNLRTAFSRNGGNVGTDGSVAWMFKQVGQIYYAPSVGNAEKVLEAAIMAGADDAESSTDGHVITTAVASFASVRDALQQALGEPEEAELTYFATQTQALTNPEQLEQIEKLLEALENDDDVQSVSSNLAQPEA
jgi:YebC/PmpR family DNA-binding regulatory protein